MKAYKYRLYPTRKQQELVNKTFGCTRLVYNLMLHDRKRIHEEKTEKLPTPAKYKLEYP